MKAACYTTGYSSSNCSFAAGTFSCAQIIADTAIAAVSVIILAAVFLLLT